jgi:hypothetical protein
VFTDNYSSVKPAREWEVDPTTTNLQDVDMFPSQPPHYLYFIELSTLQLTCRQTALEAKGLQCSSNIFAFDSCRPIEHVFRVLSTEQRTTITNIAICRGILEYIYEGMDDECADLVAITQVMFPGLKWVFVVPSRSGHARLPKWVSSQWETAAKRIFGLGDGYKGDCRVVIVAPEKNSRSV